MSVRAAGGNLLTVGQSTAEIIDGGLIFDGSETYLTKTFGSAGNRRQFTISFWIKRIKFGATNMGIFSEYPGSGNGDFLRFSDDSGGDTFRFYSDDLSAQSLVTTRQFRDTGWQHMCVAVDTTQATNTNRVKIYVNGVWNESFASSTWPDQNAEYDFNSASPHYIGRCQSGSYFPGYLSQFYFIDGQALTPSYFGYTDPLTNTWRPQKFSGNYDVLVSDATGAKPILLTSGGPLGGSTTTGAVDTTDAAKASLVIALPLQDDTTDVSNLVRGSGSAISVTAVDAKYTSSYSQYYGASGDFTDSTDRFSMEVSNAGGEFDIGTGDCTIEWWAYYPSTPGSNGYIFRSDTTNGVECYAYAHASGTVAVKFGTFTWDAWPGSGGSHTDFSNGVWNHFCIERTSGTWTAYMNGIPVRTTSGTASANPGDTMGIGNYNNSNLSYYAKCYLQDFRWYTASKYGGNAFNPPSVSVNSFNLPFDGSRPIGEDQSGKANNWTPTNFGGSVSLDKATGALPILNTVSGGRAASAGIRTDSYGNYCVLSLPLVGNALDVSNIVNSSSATKTVTVNGSVPNFAHHNFYGGSYYFDGSNDYLAVTHTTDFEMGTGEFTAEAWVYVDAHANDKTIIGNYKTSPDWQLTLAGGASNNIFMFSMWNGSSTVSAESDVLDTNWLDRWVHVAGQRKGNVLHILVDGRLAGTAAFTGSAANVSATLDIGGRGDSYGFMEGYIQDVRVYKGIAKYDVTAVGDLAYIPGSTKPDVVIDSPSSASLGSNTLDPTAGSVSFDGGTTSYLRTNVSSTDFNIAGDFTVECWVYPTEPTTTCNDGIWQFSTAIDGIQTTTSGLSMEYEYTSSSGNRFNIMVGTDSWENSSINRAPDRWYHVAMVRSSGTIKTYVDGIEDISVSNSDTFSMTYASVGGYYSTSNLFKGFISNFRFLNGTALYTAAFIPPTSPLTNITNTKLLCCQSSTKPEEVAVAPEYSGSSVLLNMALASTPFTDSSASAATVTNTGSITAVSAGTNSFEITNAASLDGSSQRLSTNNTNLPFDDVKWTFDIWFKLDSSASGYNALLNTGYGSQTSNYMYIGLDDDEKPYINLPSGATTATNAINKNEWYHMRVRSDSTNMRQYINGELVVTKGCGTTDLSSVGTKTIGSLLDNGNNANNFHGLIGPVRYSIQDLGPPPAGGLKTTLGALSNTPHVPPLTGPIYPVASTSNPFDRSLADTSMVQGRPSNYCILNNNYQKIHSSSAAINGGLTYSGPTSNSNYSFIGGTHSFSTDDPIGKYYEITQIVNGDGLGPALFECNSFSLAGLNSSYAIGNATANQTTGVSFISNGYLLEYGTNTNTGFTWDNNGDIISVAVKDNKVWFAINGVWIGAADGQKGDPASGTHPRYTWSSAVTVCPVFCSLPDGSTAPIHDFNFGQRPFAFPPPEGFGPICGSTIPVPVAVRPESYVGITTYYGNATAGRIAYTDINADLVWIKRRDTKSGGSSWVVNDTVRGASKAIYCNSTSAEYTDTSDMTAFRTDGIVLGDSYQTNSNNTNYVVYSWVGGGSAGTFNIDDVAYATAAAASMDVGDLTVTGCSVGTRSKFSIVKYTGNGSNDQTVAHGLGVIPSFVIVKDLDNTMDWVVKHRNLTSKDILYLNSDSDEDPGTGSNNGIIDDLSSTTTVNFTNSGSGNMNMTNKSSADYIMYAWADVPGLQKFGSYEGNNAAATGPFVPLGFRPAFVIIKNIDATAEWVMYDDKRDPFNVGYRSLEPSSGDAENTTATDNEIDFLSNGFRLKNDDTVGNDSNTYIYAAWAYQPLGNLYGAQSNAR